MTKLIEIFDGEFCIGSNIIRLQLMNDPHEHGWCIYAWFSESEYAFSRFYSEKDARTQLQKILNLINGEDNE